MINIIAAITNKKIPIVNRIAEVVLVDRFAESAWAKKLGLTDWIKLATPITRINIPNVYEMNKFFIVVDKYAAYNLLASPNM